MSWTRQWTNCSERNLMKRLIWTYKKKLKLELMGFEIRILDLKWCVLCRIYEWPNEQKYIRIFSYTYFISIDTTLENNEIYAWVPLITPACKLRAPEFYQKKLLCLKKRPTCQVQCFENFMNEKRLSTHTVFGRVLPQVTKAVLSHRL